MLKFYQIFSWCDGKTVLIKINLCTLLDFNAGVKGQREFRFDSLLHQQQKKLAQKTKTNKQKPNKQTKNENKIAYIYTNTQR